MVHPLMWATVLDRLVKRFPDIPPNFDCLEILRAKVLPICVIPPGRPTKVLFPVSPSMSPCQYNSKCFHLSCLPVYSSSIANELIFTPSSNWARLRELEPDISMNCIPEQLLWEAKNFCVCFQVCLPRYRTCRRREGEQMRFKRTLDDSNLYRCSLQVKVSSCRMKHPVHDDTVEQRLGLAMVTAPRGDKSCMHL